MTGVLIIFFISLLICCVISYILGQLWFGDMRNRRLRSFFSLGVQIFLWTLLNAITMVVSYEYFPVIYTVRMVMVCIIPFGILWFILNFTESGLRGKKWMKILLVAIPLIDILTMVTNPLHHYYFSNYDYPVPARAPIFWIHTALGFFFVLLSAIILFRYIAREVRNNPFLIYAGVAMIIPYVLNVLYSFGKIPFPHDTTPIGFFLTFLLFVWVSYRSQLFNIRTALFSSTMDSLEDIIILFNESLVVMDINQSALDVFDDFSMSLGRTNADAIFNYMASRATDVKPAPLFDMMKKGQDAHGECSLHFRNSETRTYTLIWRIVYEGKSKSGYMLTMMDVSNYRKMINEINEQNIKLSELKEMAESASMAKGEFLSRMSHEIRTPLNAIIGMAAIGKQTDEIGKKDYSFGKIEGASAHLLGIINDILDMSKIEAKKFELSQAEFNVKKMFWRAVSLVKFRMEEKQQSLSVHIDESIPSQLFGDDQRLAQVITNLLSNAEKFTPKGGSIQLEARLVERKNDVCVLQVDVIDQGIGISAQQQARLFQSFEQAENSTSRKFGGTGLGLTISKSIVEMMGGRIWVESEVGSGSTFSFTVQLEHRSAGQRELAPQKDIAQKELPLEEAHDEDYQGVDKDNFEGHCILVAEDVEINREILLTLLGPTRITIDCAENGAEAVQMFRAAPQRYELILMDLQMPEVDGFEATRRIRALEVPEATTVPIIALTANVFREDIERCFKAGMDDHLGKPLDIDEVLGILRTNMH